MTLRVAKPGARLVGILWLALTLAGWFDSPVVGRDGLLGVDRANECGSRYCGLYPLAMSLAGETTCASGDTQNRPSVDT